MSPIKRKIYTGGLNFPTKIPRLMKVQSVHQPTTKFIDLKSAGEMDMTDLPQYDIPLEFLDVEFKKSDDSPTLKDLMKRQSEIRTNAYDYINGYKAMLFLEEAAEMKQLSQFKHSGIEIKYDDTNDSFYFQNEQRLSSINDAFDERVIDLFHLIPQKTSISIHGRITGKNDQKFFCLFKNNLIRKMDPKTVYDISFHINRQPYQIQHQAISYVFNHDLFPLLIRNPLYTYRTEFTTDPDDLIDLTGSSACELNSEQKLAVQNIVLARNKPLPYIVFGPPGTGKTRTLVAAIEEIVQTTQKFILVCATSNAACDEIAERLASVLTSDDMFRLYSKTSNKGTIKESLLPMCNMLDGKFIIPSLQFLYQFRVLVCTLGTAACLTRSRKHAGFDETHFSYLFIDECASTHEPMAMVAIAGVITSYGKVNSSIVLAGDPKQLDAVTKSASAAKIGFKTSLLENLANLPRYHGPPQQRAYDSRYITQLVKNYRSHSSILRFPNAMFYNNSLQAMASPNVTDWYIGSSLLPSKQFPIIFKVVHGVCQNSYKETSLCNMKEVNEVIYYIKRLLSTKTKKGNPITEADIGVVTPYKLQCRRINQACRTNRINGITIGTAEQFQGQEKSVMIVSTVRAGGVCTSFVNDPRRLNVIVTRAKCLLIIIGDPHTLSTVTYWHRLIRYCHMNNAIIQDSKKFTG